MAKCFILLIIYLGSVLVSAQEFDYQYFTFSDSTNFEFQLIEERNDGDWIAIGSSRLARISSDGNLLWLRDVLTYTLMDFALDEDNYIYYLSQWTDEGNERRSYLVKLDPDGNPVWQRDFGGGIYEVEANGFHVDESSYIQCVGRMNNDTSWFNFVYQFDFAGNEVFTHRVYHKTANYTTLKAVDRAPGGRIYALGEWDHKCIIYRFNDDGSYNAFKQYELLDSLSAKDIVAYGDNDIQVLMDYYVFDDHFPYRTVIKMRVDEYLQFVSAKEYSKGQDVLKGIDLEIKEDRCFIAINDQITDSTTIVEKTNLKGDHILTREIFDQSSPQYCTDIEVRSDQSLALNYHSDSQSIFSGTNEYMQSNCDSHFGSINISDITIAYFNAFPLLLSESFPIINSSFPTSTGSTDYDSEQKCFGFASSVDSEAEIKIFPNPTIALLKIESNEVIQEIEILDQNMRIVLVPAGNLIDLSRLRPGNYIIRLRTDLTVVQKSFVKL